MSRARSLALALLIGALTGATTGCRSAMGQPDEVRRQLGPQAVVLDVPPNRQEQSEACGLACLESLLRYHGLEVDAEARARFPAARLEHEAIAASELRDYLVGRGFKVALVHGSLDESRPAGLLSLVRRGVPPLIEIASGGSRHYGLVAGFDPERRLVLVMDPSLGIVGIPYDNFEKAWAGADHFMLVAGGRAAKPASPGGS